MAYSQEKAPAASTSPCGGLITYKDKTLEVSRWRQGLRLIYEQTKEAIDVLCNHRPIAVTIPLIVTDDMTERRRGYSWLDNGEFVKPHALMEILINDQTLGLCTKVHNGLIFRTKPMMDVMNQAKEIINGLAILCSTLPGQSARATEFVEHKIRNSTRPRTFFRNHNADWLVTRRLKTENLTHKEAFIPSKVPPELQEILDFYLLVVRPVEIDFARRLWGEEYALLYHEYLFVSHRNRFTRDTFANLLISFGERFWNCGLSVSYYRHVTIEMARIYLGSEYEIYQDDQDEEEDALAGQSGHKPATRRAIYAPEHRMLPALSSDLMQRYGRASEWWWRLTGFAPGVAILLPLLRRRGLKNSLEAPETIGDGSSTVNATSGINLTTLVEQITAIVTASVSGLKLDLERHIETAVAVGVAEALNRYQPPTQEAARILPPLDIHHKSTTSAADPAPSLLKRPMLAAPFDLASGDTGDMDPPPKKRVKLSTSSSKSCLYLASDSTCLTVPLVDSGVITFDNSLANGSFETQPPSHGHTNISPAKELLQKLFSSDPHVEFRSEEQRLVVEHALLKEHNFVGILPTGGGKSLVFLIPALAEPSCISLVVVPNKALMVDLMRKTEDLGISCFKWTSRNRDVGSAAVVFLAMESITSGAFREWVYCSPFACLPATPNCCLAGGTTKRKEELLDWSLMRLTRSSQIGATEMSSLRPMSWLPLSLRRSICQQHYPQSYSHNS
jgi:hypothetical protein